MDLRIFRDACLIVYGVILQPPLLQFFRVDLCHVEMVAAKKNKVHIIY